MEVILKVEIVVVVKLDLHKKCATCVLLCKETNIVREVELLSVIKHVIRKDDFASESERSLLNRLVSKPEQRRFWEDKVSQLILDESQLFIGKVSQLILDEPVVRLLPDDGSEPVLMSISALLRSRGVHFVSTRQTKGLSVVESRGAACTRRNSETCNELFEQVQIWPPEEVECESNRALETKRTNSNEYESDEELVLVKPGIMKHVKGTPLKKSKRKPVKEHNNNKWERMVKNCLEADGKLSEK